MKYAILAAGEGSRLHQEGIRKSKPLVEINGEPMIKRLIRIFMDNSAEEIVIITNNESKEVQDYVRQLITEGMPLKLIVKTTPSSMHSFYELAPLLGQGKFCMTTVDTIFRENEFSEYIRAFQSFDGDALMAVTDYIDDEKPLYTVLDSSSNITEFSDSPSDGHNYVSGGIYGLTDSSFRVLDECIKSGQSRMRNFQRQLINNRLTVKAYPFTKILDVDHATDIIKAESFINTL